MTQYYINTMNTYYIFSVGDEFEIVSGDTPTEIIKCLKRGSPFSDRRTFHGYCDGLKRRLNLCFDAGLESSDPQYLVESLIEHGILTPTIVTNMEW
jgi:hypothetical protein